eukprot:m.369495 g.369495  ORF g.369495 m.369495 type:complete len:1434 (+) comp16677_c0_seq4:347-4648(+)
MAHRKYYEQLLELSSSGPRQRLAEALLKIPTLDDVTRKRVTPYAVHRAHHFEGEVRAAVATCIAALPHEERQPYLQTIFHLCVDDHKTVVAAALEALSTLTPEERGDRGLLIMKNLRHDERIVAEAALAAFGRLSPKERSGHVTSFVDVLDDRTVSDNIRAEAVSAFLRLTTTERQPFLNRFCALLSDERDSDAQIRAIRGFIQLTVKERKPYLAQFAKAFHVGYWSALIAVARSFGELTEPERAGLWDAFSALVAHSNRDVRTSVYETMWKLPGYDKHSKPILDQAMADESGQDHSAQASAIQATAKFSPELREPYLPGLMALLSQSQIPYKVRSSICKLIPEITPAERAPYIGALVTSFEDQRSDMREDAARSFGQLSSEEQDPFLKRYVDLFLDKDWTVKIVALETFGIWSPEQRAPFMNAFVRVVSKSKERELPSAIESIGRMLPSERAAHPTLYTACFESTAKSVRCATAKSYIKWSSEEREAHKESFHSFFFVGDAKVRLAAQEAVLSLDEPKRTPYISALLASLEERPVDQAVTNDLLELFSLLTERERAPHYERLVHVAGTHSKEEIQLCVFNALLRLPELDRAARKRIGFTTMVKERLFSSNGRRIREAVAEQFGQRDEDDRADHLDEFGELCQDQNKHVLSAALRSMGKLNWTERIPLMEHLGNAFTAASEDVRCAALEAFELLDDNEKGQLLEKFAPLLEDHDVKVNASALRCLAALTPTQRQPYLAQFSQAWAPNQYRVGNYYVSDYTIATVTCLTVAERLAVVPNILTKLSESEDTATVTEAVQLFFGLDTDEQAPHTTSLFALLLNDRAHGDNIRAPIARSLKWLPPQEREGFLITLVTSLADSTDNVRRACFATFSGLSPAERKPHLNNYLALFNHKNHWVRVSAARNFSNLTESERAPHVSAFGELCKDANEYVQREMATAVPALTESEQMQLLPQFVILLSSGTYKSCRARQIAANYFLSLPERARAPYGDAFGTYIDLCSKYDEDYHNGRTYWDGQMVRALMHVTDSDLKAFSRVYFPQPLTSDTFVPMSSRWVLPRLKIILGSGAVPVVERRQFVRAAEEKPLVLSAEDRSYLRELVKRFIKIQVEMSAGREKELARIVEETESVHREPFRVALTEIYKEAGCPAFLDRTEKLAARVLERHNGPVSQSTNDITKLFKVAQDLHPRFSKFLDKLAELSGGQHEATPLKAETRVLEKLQLSPNPDMRDNVSFACDIVRGGLVYQTMSQMSYALQLLQACDQNEADHTTITQEVLGDAGEEIRIKRTKNRFGQPNSSMYCDLMLNFVFVNDESQHVFEVQMMHENLYTIRSTGSHKFYGKTRTAREILECTKKTDMIPRVEIVTPTLKRSATTRTAWAADGVGDSAEVRNLIEEQARRIDTLEQTMQATTARLAKQEAEIKALKNAHPKSTGCCVVM